jgi:hypothetical protein
LTNPISDLTPPAPPCNVTAGTDHGELPCAAPGQYRRTWDDNRGYPSILI